MVAAISSDESIGPKRAKAMWAAMRKTPAVKAMVVVAAMCRRCMRRAQAIDGPSRKASAARIAGHPQRCEGLRGQVEDVRHGERVLADGAVCEQRADVGVVGQVARAPHAVEQRDGGGQAQADEESMREGDGAARFKRAGVGLLGARDGGRDQQQQRQVGGERVVLLVGREREEQQHDDGEDGEQKDGALLRVDAVEGRRREAGLLALRGDEAHAIGRQHDQHRRDQVRSGKRRAQRQDDEDHYELERRQELGVARQGQRLVREAPPQRRRAQRQEERPGEEPDEVRGPVEPARQLVEVGGNASSEEAQHVLVDEVEPEEAVVVRRCRDCAARRGCARARRSQGRATRR